MKKIRLSKLFDRRSGKSVLLPMDHGTTFGPINGIKDISKLIELASENKVQGIIGHKGAIYSAVNSGRNVFGTEFILHMSASTSMGPDQSFKQIISSIDHALAMGVTGISAHINFGVREEHAMIKDFGLLCDEAYRWGMPILAMVNVHKNISSDSAYGQSVAHAVRCVGELGADMCKIEYPGSITTLTDSIQSFQIPVLLAGGEKIVNKYKWFNDVNDAIQAGAKGVCIGRNIFQDQNPGLMLRALNAMVHEQKNIDEVYRMLELDPIQT